MLDESEGKRIRFLSSGCRQSRKMRTSMQHEVLEVDAQAPWGGKLLGDKLL